MSTELVCKYEEVVAHFGSQTLTAKALDVEQPSVNAWLKGKTKMSEKTALRAEFATNGEFKAVELCPSLKALFANRTA